MYVRLLVFDILTMLKIEKKIKYACHLPFYFSSFLVNICMEAREMNHNSKF